ncbi:hypothetical protein [Halobiforma nitratireducens]|nr:hypothetical protein [Halobiforma nitratireducens]
MELKASAIGTAGSDATAIAAGWIDMYNPRDDASAEIDMEVDYEYYWSGNTGGITSTAEDREPDERDSEEMESSVATGTDPVRPDESDTGDSDEVEPSVSKPKIALSLAFLGLEEISSADAAVGATYTVMKEDSDGKFTDDSKEAQGTFFEEVDVSEDANSGDGTEQIPPGVYDWVIEPETHYRLLFTVATVAETAFAGTSVATVGDLPDTVPDIYPGLDITEISYDVNWNE